MKELIITYKVQDDSEMRFILYDLKYLSLIIQIRNKLLKQSIIVLEEKLRCSYSSR